MTMNSMKCGIALALVVTVFAVIVAASVIASDDDSSGAVEDEFDVDTLRYEVVSENPNNVRVIKYIGAISEDLTIPSKVTYGGVEYNVTRIGYMAFFDCDKFTGSITIPNSVNIIEEMAFSGCSGKDFIVDDSNHSYKSVNGLLMFKDERGLIACLTGKTGSLTIPDSVISIGEWSFAGCKGLTEIKIPDSVTAIGESAFLDCKGLTEIKIPDGVTVIEDGVFFSCSGLIDMTISSSVTSIEASAFSECSGLTKITIPSSVTEISMLAFNKMVFFAEDGATLLEKNASNLSGYTFTKIDGKLIRGPVSIKYALVVIASPESEGTVTGSGTYAPNEEVTITATAKDGSKFVSWDDGNKNALRTITVKSDETYTALFVYAQPEDDSKDDNGNNAMIYVAVGVIVVLIAGLAAYYMFFKKKI